MRSTLAPDRARLCIVDAYPDSYGGSQRVTELLSAELAAHDWTVTVVAPAEGSSVARLRAAGCTVTVAPAPAALLRYAGTTRGWRRLAAVAALPVYWWRLARLLRAESDVVWVHELRGLLLAGPAARLARRPLVWHLHAVPPQLARLVRWLRPLAAVVVVPSAALAARLRLPPRAVTVLPNAVIRAAGPTAPQPQPPQPQPPQQPLVVCLARLHPVKGVDVLLEASARLAAAGIAHRVVVAGGEQPGHQDYAANLRRRRDALGLAGVVELRGEVADVAPLLAQARLVVQPSRSEGFGLAVLEAMAAGRPVVATRVGGLPDLVVEGQTGLLVPPEDPAALAGALSRLLTDADEAARFGAAGQRRAADHFGADRFAAGAAALLAAVAQR